MRMLSQMAVLDEAVKSHPNSWWWLKADGCDINTGLMESTRLQWSGDVDLNDGTLQAQYSAYLERLAHVEGITVEQQNLEIVIEQLHRLSNELSDDLDFIDSGKYTYCTCMLHVLVLYVYLILLTDLRRTDRVYSEKQRSGKSGEKMLVILAWKLKELTDLNEEGRQLNMIISSLIEKLHGDQCDVVQDNIPRQVSTLRERMYSFIRRLTRHKRTAATHILVFMISPEDRRRKPYAIPVQCIPYRSLTDAKARELASMVIHEMIKRNMKVAGRNVHVCSTMYICTYTCK